VLTRVLEVISRAWREDLSAPLGVAELADRAGISRGHLARVCKQHLGVSPQELLRLLRLEHAVLLLTRSDLKVQAVSELCGFANPFHFSRCCTRAYGQAPSAIREAATRGAGRPPSAAPGIRRLYQQLIAAGTNVREFSA
jgi:transcriptional regulator GlxA family with amidase domain